MADSTIDRGTSVARTLPDFIGIGTQRAATTWFYECLRRHPEVYMPTKEIHFFDAHYERGASWYAAQFAGRPAEAVAAGEFTPDYLADGPAVIRMARHVPDAKLFAILREPAERAISAYNFYVLHGRYPDWTFEEALERDATLVGGGLHARNLERLYAHYPAEQVRIYLHDDILRDPAAVLADAFAWLGVDPCFRPDVLERRFNVASLPRLQRVIHAAGLAPLLRAAGRNGVGGWLQRKIGSRRNGRAGRPAEVAELKTLFRDDVLKLQDLLGRDLSHWLSHQQPTGHL